MLAYEWSNFRLASPKVNSRKGKKVLAIDPFAVLPGEFTLNLISGEVVPGQTTRLADVSSTIRDLRLNDPPFPDQRIEYVRMYRLGEITLGTLRSWFPFGAADLQFRGLL